MFIKLISLLTTTVFISLQTPGTPSSEAPSPAAKPPASPSTPGVTIRRTLPPTPPTPPVAGVQSVPGLPLDEAEEVEGFEIEIDLGEEGMHRVLGELAPLMSRYVNLSQAHAPMAISWLGESAGAQATEEASFLGVGTEPVASQTAAQLPIRRGTGLSIVSVTEESPAAQAGLARYDVLAKLDDQLLVNSEQFAALIRGYDPGAVVKLTYYRGGREFNTTATLASRKQPVLAPGGRRTNLGFDTTAPAQFLMQRFGDPAQLELELAELMKAGGAIDKERLHEIVQEQMQNAEQFGVRAREEAERAVARIRRMRDESRAAEQGAEPNASAPQARRVRAAPERMVWDDGETRIERTHKDGKPLLVISEEGVEVYRGPMPEGAEREKLDPRIREKLAAFSSVSLPPPAPPAPPVGPGAATRTRVAPPAPPAPPPEQN